MDTALVLVHKKPQLGIGKQRLATRFGTKLTFRIAQSLLECALEDALAWPGSVVLAPASACDTDWARELANSLSRQYITIPQVDGNLGQRLNALDHELRNRGLKQLVYIGSDAPGLNSEDYDTARNALNDYDVTLMPASDGGVALMANRAPWPDLTALPWSTAKLGVTLAEKCRDEMLSVHHMRECYDIDEPQDFIALVDRLASDNRPARRALHALACEVASTIKITHDIRHD